MDRMTVLQASVVIILNEAKIAIMSSLYKGFLTIYKIDIYCYF